jgi:outer membrane protein assembly factor BamA
MKPLFCHIIWGLLLITKLYAQDKKPRILLMSHTDTVSTTKNDSDLVKLGVPQKDMGDVFRQWFKKKNVVAVDSVTAKPQFSVIPAIGYTLTSGFAVVLSGNMAFRTGPKSRISTILASTDYTQKAQFTLPIQTNIWSKNNSFNYIGEYKFFKYPQSTYGLGSNSNLQDENPMDYTFVRFYQVALHKVTNTFYLGAGYIYDNHWHISDEGSLNGSPNAYAQYGKTNQATSTGLTLNGVYDTRDDPIFPLKGFYANIQYRNNFTFMGSTVKWSSLIVDMRKYIRLPANSENVLALWSYNWLILNGTPSYLDLPSTSWDTNTSTGRGYIQGRFRGAQMLYFETEYRYRITKNGLLGGVIFANAESFSAAPGTHLQAIQPSIGPGLRLS